MSDTNKNPVAAAPPEAGERIAKRMARAGLCSRRDAERLIAEGRVSVNGTVLTTAACVVTQADRIVVDGEPLPDKELTRVFRYCKPAGLVTTARDEKGRATVFDRLPDGMPRVVSIGRLDLNSEGLMLLTNDGELARHLELPSTGWLRRYRVRVHGHPTADELARLKDGVFIDGIEYGPIEAELDRIQGANAWVTVGLREGKNREVRKVMEHLHLPVTRLIRTAYGPFQLGKLLDGEVEEVPRRILRDFLPEFFPKLERGTTVAPAAPRLRLDKAPRGAAPKAASTEATGKGGRAVLRARTPDAKSARGSVERALEGSRPAAADKPRRSNDWRDDKPRGQFPDQEMGAAPKRVRPPRPADGEDEGIRIKTTRGRPRPGMETQRAVSNRIAARTAAAGGPAPMDPISEALAKRERRAAKDAAARSGRGEGGKGPGGRDSGREGRGAGGRDGGRGPGAKGPGMKGPGGRGADRRR